MKKIAILTCLEATKVCSGASCFRAFNGRTQFFEIYRDVPVDVVAFFHCNGCDADYQNDSEYKEKIERVASMNPDVLHVGKCTRMNNKLCPVIKHMMDYFADCNIKIIEGTH